MSLLNTLLKTDNGISFAAPWEVQEPKIFQLQGGSAPGPRWGLCLQTPVIGSRSTRSPWPRPLLAPPTFKHFQRPCQTICKKNVSVKLRKAYYNCTDIFKGPIKISSCGFFMDGRRPCRSTFFFKILGPSTRMGMSVDRRTILVYKQHQCQLSLPSLRGREID